MICLSIEVGRLELTSYWVWDEECRAVYRVDQLASAISVSNWDREVPTLRFTYLKAPNALLRLLVLLSSGLRRLVFLATFQNFFLLMLVVVKHFLGAFGQFLLLRTACLRFLPVLLRDTPLGPNWTAYQNQR